MRAGASSSRCSHGARVKIRSSGAFLNPAADYPPGRIAAAEDPSAERGDEGSVARSKQDNLPIFPSRASRNEVPKAGVPTI